ncbi:hypothetical protein LUTEI9C_140260 [Luteimonas sp. 9C]|uniref:hypothetical protein n=1 Tax=Luteimonas sp. 9C TaxID=2653148 RepID=UPI0012F147CC|nr:hypothetical protein [Luteimonas sp. 9C]VXB33451.1 hypothetical protein LUTEI9C_140260 [Luteimonas sp. 9C]
MELLRRSRHPEVRYTLERQGEILASVDVLPMPWRRFPDVRVRLPIQAECEPQGRMWNRRYALRSAHRPVATVFHPHRFTLRTQLAVDIAPGEPVLPLVFAAYVIKEILY